MKPGTKLYYILFAVYMFFVFSPFMFPVLNQIEPFLLGMPFTVWYIHLVILVGCALVYYGSKKLWTSYDDSVKEEEK